ncbi:MAG: hypothetical protein WBW27_09635, partial [Pseudolabrys sp.]
IEPAPNQSVDWPYQRRVALGALKNVKLMAKRDELELQGHSLTKAERQQSNERRENHPHGPKRARRKSAPKACLQIYRQGK